MRPSLASFALVLPLAFLGVACGSGSASGTGSVQSPCAAPDVLGPLGFESGYAPTEGAAHWQAAYDSYGGQPIGGIVTDASAHGGKSMHVHWTYEGKPGGDQAALVYAYLPARATKIYARMRYKQAPGFDNTGLFKKMIRMFGPNFDGETVGTFGTVNGQPIFGYDGLDPEGGNKVANVGDTFTSFEPFVGEWHSYQVFNDISDPAHLRFRVWVDGVLRWDYVVTPRTILPQQYIGIVMFNGNLNGPGTTADEYLDDLSVSTSCIAES